MTRLGAKIPVETLAEERYARIEGRVMAGYRDMTLAPPPRRPMWARLRAPVAALAVVAALVVLYVGVRGWPGTSTHSAHEMIRVVTNDTGQSRYRVGEAELVAGPNTILEIRREPADGAVDAIHVDLMTGVVDCDVARIPGRAPFVVHAGTVDVTVVGTAFRVARDGDEVRVQVSRGTVRVDGPDGGVLLNAGESWSGPTRLAYETRGTNAETDADRADADRANAGQPNDDTEAEKGKGDGTQGDDTGGAEGDDTAGRGRDEVSENRAGDDHAGAGRAGANGPSGPSGSRSGAGGPGDSTARLGSRTGKTPDASRGHGERHSAGDRGAELARTPEGRELAGAEPARGQAPSSDADLAGIMALESEDPEVALERYRELALGRGSEAEFALYSMAYVQHLRLGESREALATLHHYERRFARGAHRESALWLRIRILCEGEDRKKCRAAAHSYLSRFPGGHHRELAGRIIHWDM